jgi:hypothetical protein
MFETKGPGGGCWGVRWREEEKMLVVKGNECMLMSTMFFESGES